MLVIMMENQLLSPAKICCNCPMASQSGLPRWRQGQLRCGRPVGNALAQGPTQYECTMGFKIAELSDN